MIAAPDPVLAGELVLQFRGPRVETEDEVAEIEDALFELLADGDAWTGHEITHDVRNIVFETHDGAATFARVLPFLERAGLVDALAAGVRGASATSYVALWPPGRAFSRT